MKANGVFLIDKPKDFTSFQVVKQIRKITRIKKAGHTGTLDPFATGLLPICIGKATRISQYLLADTKMYQVQATFGIQTDTADITGTIIKKNEKKITQSQFQNIIPEISAINKQIPPQYSAIKINGKKAYDYARANQRVELAERSISIAEFSLLDFQFPSFAYSVKVSKGTYIRTLTEQIAELLGTIATTTKLRRIQVGNLAISESTPLDALTSENWQNYLIPIDKILSQFPVIRLNYEQSSIFLHGNMLPVKNRNKNTVIVKSIEDNILGLGFLEEDMLQPKIVFNGE
jgi:tRNA pseudouridine55 synthase